MKITRSMGIGLRALLAAGALATMAACGDTEEEAPDDREATATVDAAYAARANAICTEMGREKAALLDGAFGSGGSGDALTAITEGLVAPGLRILEREAERLRALEPRPDNEELETYLGLFDPIIVLADERLRTGRAGNIGSSRDLERLVVGLEERQRAAAVAAGLDRCGVGFAGAIAGGKAPGG